LLHNREIGGQNTIRRREFDARDAKPLDQNGTGTRWQGEATFLPAEDGTSLFLVEVGFLSADRSASQSGQLATAEYQTTLTHQPKWSKGVS
jgi:hypothetical protein